jgi:uncharacterized protein DUF3276
MDARELYVEKVRVGRRTYFLDLKQGEHGERYLVLTESKRLDEGEFKHHRVVVAEEHLEKFLSALDALLSRAGLAYRMEVERKRQERLNRRTPGPERASSTSFKEIREEYPNAYVRWTEDDDTDLKNAYEICKEIETLADTFQRKPGAIRSRLTKLGLLHLR